jgi:hypothetical protein
MLSSLTYITGLAAITLAVLTSAVEVQDDLKRSPYNPKRTFVLVGVDSTSNPYVGDTSISEAHSMLCLLPLGLPQPAKLTPAAYVTPGGATRNSWSGGKLFAIPLVEGAYLTSQSVADGLCSSYGETNFGVTGARMAEFHDGDTEVWAGWAFWSEALLLPQNGAHTFDGRLWVRINDQETNPWSTSDSRTTKALTFVKLAEQGGYIIVDDGPILQENLRKV